MCEGASQKLVELFDLSRPKNQCSVFVDSEDSNNAATPAAENHKNNPKSNTNLIFEGCSLILIPREHVKLRLAVENGGRLTMASTLDEAQNEVVAETNLEFENQDIQFMFEHQSQGGFQQQHSPPPKTLNSKIMDLELLDPTEQFKKFHPQEVLSSNSASSSDDDEKSPLPGKPGGGSDGKWPSDNSSVESEAEEGGIDLSSFGPNLKMKKVVELEELDQTMTEFAIHQSLDDGGMDLDSFLQMPLKKKTRPGAPSAAMSASEKYMAQL